MKTGLVLEGGAFRTIFSCGVCDAFLDAGLPLPDYTVGVSAGIAYGVSYLSRQSRRNLKLLTTYANDKRYMGVGNFLDRRNRSYFGLKFSYETIPNELLPFDYETFAAYPGTVEAVVTNLNTGRAEYLEVPRKDEHFLLLQATCAIPLMFPVIHLDGQPYLDGGVGDAIPWRRALEQGCDRVLVVLTRPREYRRKPDKLLSLVRKKYRDYPNFVAAMEQRAQVYNQALRVEPPHVALGQQPAAQAEAAQQHGDAARRQAAFFNVQPFHAVTPLARLRICPEVSASGKRRRTR